MMTTTKVTDLRSAAQAIREAAIPCDGGHYAAGATVHTRQDAHGFEQVTVFGLCRETYQPRGSIGDSIRVHHSETYAWADFTLDPARDWVEQIEDIVDWLATECPVEAVPYD